MENINLHSAIEKIDFLIKSLIDFSNENKYDFALYNSFANQSSKSFNRYFSEIDNQTIKEKIISDLKTDFHFQVDDIVTSMMATRKNKVENFEPGVTYNIGQVIPDNRLKGFENNYKQLIELFLNRVEFNLFEQAKQYKTSTAPPAENRQVKTFKEFFNKEVSDEIIQKIKVEFKEQNGKKLAFLIYLLHKVHKLIDYSSNSKTEARKHFILGLTGKSNIVAGVDKIFNLNDVTIKDPKFESDNDYITIKEKLQKTII